MSLKVKLLPKGIQSFEKMISDNYIYIDKTRYIYDIITKGSYYFFSRPRRFGKSLLISTLAALFSGNRELFTKLSIAKTDFAWQKHPVIQLSFASMANDTPESFYNDLLWKIESIAETYAIDISRPPSLQTKFETLVTQLSSKNSVVILIDEYDYPILSNIDNSEHAIACRNILRDFFAPIKDLDKYLRFVFITGVSKFSKTSIFSGLNNLEDLTLSADGANLLGYTEQEIQSSFTDYIKAVALHNKISPEAAMDKIKEWYNGYRFTDDTTKPKVYNPYSVLLFLSSGKFLNYWYETGTPSFLLNLIKTKQFPLTNLDAIAVGADELGTIDIDDIPVPTLLFQTGYLTIDHYNSESGNYHLSFPNFEVESSFLKNVLKRFAKTTYGTINSFVLGLTKALTTNNIDLFCRILQTFFAEIPSGIQIPHLEKYYQTILYVLLKILGLTVNVEIMTNIGRIDLIIEHKEHLYLFEFKMQGSAKEALQQIEDKKYYQKYLMSYKHITIIGIKFDTKQRNLDDWIIKEIK